MFYVYFLQSCKNNKVYVGFSTKLPTDRLEEHHSGTNKWTRENGPFILSYYETYLCKADALKREQFYKSGFGRTVRNAVLKAVSAKGGPASGGG